MSDEPVKMGRVFCSKATRFQDGSFKSLLIQDLEIVNGEPTWIPYSHIHDDSEVYRPGDQGELVVKRWFAEKRGWV